MAGVNQTTMLALSMVVIASMIGAPGLGRGVLSALQRTSRERFRKWCGFSYFSDYH